MTKAHKTLTIYSIAGIILLGIAVFLTLAYDAGYRLNGFSVEKTSTITVNVSEPDTSVFIGDTFVRTTTGDYESVTIPNIDSGKELISVVKNTYSPWAKRIEVPANSSLQLYPYVVPFEYTQSVIGPGTVEYGTLWQSFFRRENKVLKEYSTEKYAVSSDEQGISIRCLETSDCKEIEPLVLGVEVTALYQYKNNPNVLIYSTQNGIYITEIDGGNTERISHTLYEGQNVVFYPENEQTFVVSDAGTLFRIIL